MAEAEAISPEQIKADDSHRMVLENKLNNGLKTQIEPRAYSSEEVNGIVARLQTLEEADYNKKLANAGFTLTHDNPGDDDDQACDTCMYFLIHRKFCELPELMLPVEVEWSCRLWRIC